MSGKVESKLGKSKLWLNQFSRKSNLYVFADLQIGIGCSCIAIISFRYRLGTRQGDYQRLSTGPKAEHGATV